MEQTSDFEKHNIVRIRYNSETDDFDFLPTMFSADTRAEAVAIAFRLTDMDDKDEFTVEAA